jgi:SAM-dependent methyltransferase
MMDLDYSRHYRKWHPNTDEHYEESSIFEAQDIEKYLPRNRDSRIFEFGAGMGLCLFALRKLGYSNLIGIDSDRSQVDAARSRGLPVELVPVDETLDWLHQRGKSFEFVYAVDVIEHIPRQHTIQVIRAIADTLEPSATFVCRVPNCNSIVGSRQRYIDWTHEVSFSPESLDFVLYNGGFSRIEVIAAADPPWLGVGGFVRGALRLLFRSVRRLQYFAEATGGERTMPLSSNLLAVCRK